MRVDVPTRYFLRRLAQARRSPYPATAARAYSSALSEVIASFVLMPGIAVLCITARIGMSLPPEAYAPSLRAVPPLVLATLLTILLVAAGHLWFIWHLRRFRGDHSRLAEHFDTEDDRQIVFWQKLILTVICGVIVPLSALSALAEG